MPEIALECRRAEEERAKEKVVRQEEERAR